MKRIFQAFAALSFTALLAGCCCPGGCPPYGGPNCGGWCGPSPVCSLVTYPFVLLEQILCLPSYGCGYGYGGGCCGYYGGCPTPCCDAPCCDTPCCGGGYGPQMGGDCCPNGSCGAGVPAGPMMDGQWMQSPPTPVSPQAAPPAEQQQAPATQNGNGNDTTMYSHPMGGYVRGPAGAPRPFAPMQSMTPMQSMAPMTQTMVPVQTTLPAPMAQQQWVPVNH